MNTVDITLSVLLEKASQEYQGLTERLMKEHGLSVDLIELAIEKSLLSVKNQKLSLYSSALLNLKKQSSPANIPQEANAEEHKIPLSPSKVETEKDRKE